MIHMFLIFCALCIFGIASEPQTSSTSTVAHAQEEPPLAWAGPGLYEGQWFDTEEDYQAYIARHDKHGHDRHRSKDRHHDKHHKHHHKDRKKDHHNKGKKHHK